MESTHSITRAHVQPFLFHEAELEVARNNGDLWISIRRVCEALGLAFAAQLVKLKKKVWACIEYIPTVAPDGKVYQSAFLHLDSLPSWLTAIEPSRVRPEVRPKLELFQLECHRVLRNHFFGKAHEESPPPAPPPRAPFKLARAEDTPKRAWREGLPVRASESDALAIAEQRAIHHIGEAWEALVEVWSNEHNYKAAKVYADAAKLLCATHTALFELDVDRPTVDFAEAACPVLLHTLLARHAGAPSRLVPATPVGTAPRAASARPTPLDPAIERAILSALTVERQTAGDIAKTLRTNVSAKSIGRFLVRRVGTEANGRVVRNAWCSITHQWLWWGEVQAVDLAQREAG